MDELALDAKKKMEECLVNLQANYNTLRTGRASASLLDRISCDYYGDKMPINQICGISSPEPRQLIVKPYDRSDVKAVYAAIAASDQNLNPTVNGDQIFINIPALTEEKRKELAKKAKSYTEESKVQIRNVRRDYMDLLKDSDEYSEDLEKSIKDDIEKVTTEVLKKADDAFSAKEKEILSI
jgi:ribosome recycling factor